MHLNAWLTPRRPVAAAAALIACLIACAPAHAYIDQNPQQFTLPRLLLEFRSAGLFEIERLDLEKGSVRFKPLELFQGHAPPEGINHLITLGRRVPPELQGLKVGQKAVLFRDDPWGRAVTMIGGAWYVSSWNRPTGWARINRLANVFFECGFCGSVPELADACRTLLRGEDVVVRCRPKPEAPETQWVSCSLREPHRRAVVPAPPDAPTPPDPVPPAPAPAAPESLPALLEQLRAEAPRARREAADAIARIGPPAKDAAAVLLDAFPGEKDPFARRAMIAALGAIGPDPRQVAPALVLAVRDGYGSVDDLVGYEASVALARIDPDGAFCAELVAGMLHDEKPDVRRRAAAMVRMLGPELKALAPALAAAVKDPNPGVRAEAVRSLTAIHPDPALAVPALTAALADPGPHVRIWAATGLASYGADSASATKALIEAVSKEQHPHAKGQQIRALRYIGPAAAEAVPLLTEALKDPNEMVRSQAERALKRIQPTPPPPPPPPPKPEPAPAQPQQAPGTAGG